MASKSGVYPISKKDEYVIETPLTPKVFSQFLAILKRF